MWCRSPASLRAVATRQCLCPPLWRPSLWRQVRTEREVGDPGQAAHAAPCSTHASSCFHTSGLQPRAEPCWLSLAWPPTLTHFFRAAPAGPSAAGEVLTPASAKDPGFLARVRELAPDLAVTAAYGNMLPQVGAGWWWLRRAHALGVLRCKGLGMAQRKRADEHTSQRHPGVKAAGRGHMSTQRALSMPSALLPPACSPFWTSPAWAPSTSTPACCPSESVSIKFTAQAADTQQPQPPRATRTHAHKRMPRQQQQMAVLRGTHP